MDRKSSQCLTIHHMPHGLDTIWLIILLNFDHIFTPKGNLNRCIQAYYSYYITTISLLGILNTSPQAPVKKYPFIPPR